MKPVTERRSVARVIRGTERGPETTVRLSSTVSRIPIHTATLDGVAPVKNTVARYIRYICHCSDLYDGCQKAIMPDTETAQSDTPEQVMTHQPSNVIQPTTKAANRL